MAGACADPLAVATVSAGLAACEAPEAPSVDLPADTLAVVLLDVDLSVVGAERLATSVPGGWLIHCPRALSLQTVSPTSRRI
ncbi:MAG: hypothetical protein ACWGMY_01900 [Hyphomicrobiaceae bacterium]